MPPKSNDASKKTQEKAKNKIIEDKTFGLKNKKGKKQQQYIKNVQQQVKGNMSLKDTQAQIQRKKDMEAAKKEQEDLKSLFKVVIDKPKVNPGVDPKCILCPHFKHGLCKKGDKCIYSHDLEIERKQEKKDLYVDIRQDETSAGWTQSQLEEVIKKKDTQANNPNRTEIVCKYFLDAVDKETYGWFWICPNNGDNCQYRHALPPGYILKKDKPNSTSDTGPVITIEELIEEERYNLLGNLTPVNSRTFSEWKRKIIQRKKEDLSKDQQKKKAEILSGKITSRISGKEIFTFDPNLANQDDEDMIDKVDDVYQRETDENANDDIFVDIRDEDFVIQDKTVPDDRATFVNSLNPTQREAVNFISSIEFDQVVIENQIKSKEKSNDDLILDEELLEKEIQNLDILDT